MAEQEITPDPEEEPTPNPEPEAPQGDPDPEVEEPAKGKGEPDWKAMARKHEREAKKARAEREALAAKLKDREDADKSEHEKAIEVARQEGEQAALSKYEQQRRDDKIETETVKLAGRDITVGDGDKAQTLRFADADDAHVHVERAIRRGDLEYDDIYEDGKVKRDALTDFLADLLAEKPHLRAQASNGAAKKVDFDGGKGKSAGTKALEEMTPDEHLKAVQAANR